MTSTKKFLGLFEKSFSRDIKTAFYVFKWKLGEKVFGNLLLSSIFFWWAEKFELSMKTFPQSVKTVSYVWTATTREKICSSFISKCYFFGVSVKIFSRGSSKLHYICSQPTYEHLINFWWKICTYKFFGMWAKNNQTVRKKTWQESMLHVRRKLLVSHTFFWKECFFLLEVWEFELKNINSLIKITGSPLKTVF